MSEQVTIAGRQIEVKGLTMRQIKDVMAALKKSDVEPNIVDVVFNDSVPAVAVAAATGLSLAELEGEISQLEMRQLLDKVRAINPFFVGMTERLLLVTPSAPSSVGSAS